jgi:electron transfer flavoprotein alpha subunit
MVGVGAAGPVVAGNPDPVAPVLAPADIGIVGDALTAAELLATEIARTQSARV